MVLNATVYYVTQLLCHLRTDFHFCFVFVGNWYFSGGRIL